MGQGSTPSSTFYESYYDVQQQRWQIWQDVVPEYQQPVPFQFSKIMVPTSDSITYTFLLEKVCGSGQPVLFVGEPGTAKTVTIQNFLNKLPRSTTSLLNIN